MTTEHSVRQELEMILRSDSTPMRRVRALVGLAQQVRKSASVAIMTRDLSSRTENVNAAAHLDRLVQSHRMLHDEVRLAAWNVLMQTRETLAV
jgi:hypothetical protein